MVMVVDIVLTTTLPIPKIHQCTKGKRYRGLLTEKQASKSPVVFTSEESGAECMAFANEFKILREVKNGNTKKDKATKHKDFA